MSNSRLHSLINGRRFKPVFQPIVDLNQAKIAGYETLTRPDPELGYKHAGELFDEAITEGMTWELEAATREVSIRAAEKWPHDQLLFMNASPSVVADPRFVQSLNQHVEGRPGLMTNRLVVEITERSEQQYVDGLHQQTEALIAGGFNLAIDDVGAGTSGLNRILQLRPHWLKLDRDLVDGIASDPVRQNLVRFILHFVTLSGVQLIAEGIENHQDLQRLIDIGVRFGQGYLLGMPGERGQQLDPQLRAWIRSVSRGSASSVQSQSDITIQHVVSEPLRIGSMKSIGDAAKLLLGNPGRAGVLVEDQTRCLGWCDRELVLRLATGKQGLLPIASVTHPRRFFVEPRDSIINALDTASIAAASGNQPLIVTDGDTATGVVALADLLRFASKVCGGMLTRAAPITGLPGRVRSEEHLKHLIDVASADSERTWDVAFVDLQGFSEYNDLFGFDLGDNLIRDLAGAIQTALAPAGEPFEWFLGHLGDDRFLITSNGALLEDFAGHIVDRFARRALGTLIGGNLASTGFQPSVAPGRVGVRVLVVPDAFSRFKTSQEIFQAELVMRRMAKEQTAAHPGSPGSVVFLPEDEPLKPPTNEKPTDTDPEEYRSAA